MDLLEVIFKAITRIQGESTPNKKKLVFALRDFRNDHNLENIKKSFARDINDVWGKIMPNGPQIDNYFEIEYVTLPHIWYEKFNFLEKFEQLRARF